MTSLQCVDVYAASCIPQCELKLSYFYNLLSWMSWTTKYNISTNTSVSIHIKITLIFLQVNKESIIYMHLTVHKLLSVNPLSIYEKYHPSPKYLQTPHLIMPTKSGAKAIENEYLNKSFLQIMTNCFELHIRRTYFLSPLYIFWFIFREKDASINTV